MKYIEKVVYALIIMGMFIFILGFYVKNYNSIFLLLGGTMILIGFLSAIFMDRKDRKIVTNEYEIWKENLIKNGLKIEVYLEKVEIKSSTYGEEIIDNDGYSTFNKYKSLEALVGNDNQKYNTIKESILLYETELLERKMKFHSPIISKDEITLQFLLNNQKKTFIYHDKHDINNYLFDIDFLYK